VKETSKEISNYLKETNKILRVSNASADWRGTPSSLVLYHVHARYMYATY
jgi:hypothetical protein